MSTAALTPDLKRLLDEVFTRTYVSMATYFFEAQPYTVPEDAPLVARIEALKEQDRDHATLIANLLRAYGEVPEAGVFPYWHRDLNYMTVPYLAGFVAESLETDLALIDRTLAAAPEGDETLRSALTVMRAERAAHREAIAPVAAEARVREAQAYAAASKAIRDTREARLAAEKAAEAARKEAERKQKAAAKAKADAEAAATSAAAAPGAADPAAGMPDPNEPGISSKEKAKRTMMIKRARKKAEEAAAAGGGAPAAAPAADPTAGMPDPNEPGISSKEKAKRTMMIRRAQKAAEAAAAAGTTPAADPAPATSTPAAPTKTLEEVLAAMPDPDEAGISGKEKAKRTVMRNRAKKQWETEQAAPAADAPAEGSPASPDAPASTAPTKTLEEVLAAMPDPDEAGISGKEKAKRTVMRNRAKKAWEAENG